MRVIPGNVIILEMSEDEASGLLAVVKIDIWRHLYPDAGITKEATHKECLRVLHELRGILDEAGVTPDYEGMR